MIRRTLNRLRLVYIFDVTQATGTAARVPAIIARPLCRLMDRHTGGFHDYAVTATGL